MSKRQREGRALAFAIRVNRLRVERSTARLARDLAALRHLEALQSTSIKVESLRERVELLSEQIKESDR